MKITLDSNVIIAGFIARGTCELLLQKWFQQHFEVVLSDYILEEVKKSLQKKLKIQPSKIKEIELLLKKNATWVKPEKIKIKTLRDPSDLPILGTAIAGNSKFLITGDQDLLTLKRHKLIKIMTPRNFLDLGAL
jgi:putative PIN family toxin of toxin-antitoxin system